MLKANTEPGTLAAHLDLDPHADPLLWDPRHHLCLARYGPCPRSQRRL